MNDIFTVPVNLAGLPALSLPAGVDKQGHPLGLQLIGKALDEQKILNIGYAFEKNCCFKHETPCSPSLVAISPSLIQAFFDSS